MQIQGWSVAGKSWTAFLGGLLISVLPIVPTIAGALPLPWGPILSGIGLILSGIAGVSTYHAPYQPVPPPVAPDRPGHVPWTINPD